jgi:hypothetical protein
MHTEQGDFCLPAAFISTSPNISVTANEILIFLYIEKIGLWGINVPHSVIEIVDADKQKVRAQSARLLQIGLDGNKIVLPPVVFEPGVPL